MNRLHYYLVIRFSREFNRRGEHVGSYAEEIGAIAVENPNCVVWFAAQQFPFSATSDLTLMPCETVKEIVACKCWMHRRYREWCDLEEQWDLSNSCKGK